MSIKDFSQKIKGVFEGEGPRDAYVIIILILTALGSFGLGRWSSELSAGENPVVLLEGKPLTATAAAALVPVATTSTGVPNAAPSSGSTSSAGKTIVASSKGTKYYFTWCSGAKSLSEANKIYFTTEAEAQAVGLTKSSTCK